MGRRCTVCEHPDRAEIEAAVASRVASNRRIAPQYGLTERALRRHMEAHILRSTGFVGRTRELGEIDAGLAAAASGQGALYLVVGEPGIGKSRLLEEVASRAARLGSLAVWGRCWEGGGAPVLWPWKQALRALGHDGATPDVFTGLELGISDDAERFGFFWAVTDTLRSAAERQPLVLLFDDVHSADAASLLLMRFAARELRDAPVLVVASYRDIEARRSPELAQSLAELGRDARRLQLDGLASPDVAALVEAIAGSRQPESFVRAVQSATDGNPFFIDEVVRLNAGTGAFRIPDGVREAIRTTLRPLDADHRRLLEAASVIGRNFDPTIVARVCDTDADETVAALRASGVVVDAREGGGSSFSHALVRETVYDDLRPGTRVQLHRFVAEALDGAQATEAELAHHYFLGAQAGCAPQAVEHAGRAADEAMTAFAYEEAADHYASAVQALGLCEPDEERRCDLLVAQADALARCGRGARANAVAIQAADAAQALGDAARLAASVRTLTNEAAFAAFNAEFVGLIEVALASLGDTDSSDRAVLLARLAQLLAFDDRVRSGAAAREAIATARRLAEERTLSTVLVTAHRAMWDPDNAPERLAAAAEVLGQDATSGARFLALAGRAAAHLELADRLAAGQAIRELATLADRLMQDTYQWHARIFETALAVVDGRLEEAEQLAGSALQVGTAVTQQQDATFNFGAQLAVVRRAQGRLQELEGELTSFAESSPSVGAWRAALAVLYAESGRVERARHEIRRVPVAGLPRDVNWLLTVTLLAEAAAAAGDEDTAAALYPPISPYGGRIVLVGYGAACYGPVDRYLGQLAATCGRWEDADGHFAGALQTSRLMGARVWEADVALDRGRALLRRGRQADRVRAAALLASAAEGYAALGLQARAQAATAELDGAGGESAPEQITQHSTFERDGTSWRIVYEGAEFRVRDSHGMQYLAYLLARPARELHVLDLVSAAGGSRDRVASGDAGDILDAPARAAYRRRVEELRIEIADAEERGATESAHAAQDELDAIARELAAGLGLGGRARRGASEAERARLNVTRAIRTAVRAVDAVSPSLGRYLDTTVRTGVFCSYTPDERFPVTWSV